MAKKNKYLSRLEKSSSPPAAVLGAFASFLGAASGHPSAPRRGSAPTPSLVQIGISESKRTPAAISLDREYARTLVLGSATSAHPFRRTLSGIAIGPGDAIYVLGDEEMRVYEPGGGMVGNWKAPEGASCLAVDEEERVYFGRAGRVEISRTNGARMEGFAVASGNRPARITAIKVSRAEILVADADSKLIKRFSRDGGYLGAIGAHEKNRGFMLPNRYLDIDVDSSGVIHATDPGRHRISSWEPDGSPAGYFGKFGLKNPEDFVGCCNPVNLAIDPGGNIVAAEKVAARVKVYSPDGKLLALIGSENFDLKCEHFYLAVDSKGRIFVADPMRREVIVFSPVINDRIRKNV